MKDDENSARTQQCGMHSRSGTRKPSPSLDEKTSGDGGIRLEEVGRWLCTGIAWDGVHISMGFCVQHCDVRETRFLDDAGSFWAWRACIATSTVQMRSSGEDLGRMVAARPAQLVEV